MHPIADTMILLSRYACCFDSTEYGPNRGGAVHLHSDQPHVHKGPLDVPGPTSSGNQNSEDAFYAENTTILWEYYSERPYKKERDRD